MTRDSMTRERAETLALDALAFLAGNPGQIGRFLGNSGLDAAELRLRAAEPDMLRAVLDFLLTDDGLVADFCKEQGLDPRDIHRANHSLGAP